VSSRVDPARLLGASRGSFQKDFSVIRGLKVKTDQTAVRKERLMRAIAALRQPRRLTA
jgi:hypothetical protein